MNTADSLYRLLKKKGPYYFESFIKANPKYKELAEEVLKFEKRSIIVT